MMERRKERRNPKEKTDFRKVHRKLKDALLYAGLDRKGYEVIQPKLARYNLTSLKGISALTAVYMLIMLASSFGNQITLANRLHFIWCFCICTGIFISVVCGILKSGIAAMLAVYVYLGSILSYGIAIGLTEPTQTAGSFIVFIMAGPLIFYDRPLRLSVFIWIFVIVYLVICIRTKSEVARDTDVINCLSYGFISCVLNTGSMLLKVNRVWLEDKMQTVAETDSLTNLKNRNCFDRESRDLVQHAKKSVSCIYIDANGLHAINNQQGHEAGDRMLKFLAEQLVILFGKESSYRAGGDEFMVFCCDVEEELLLQRIETLSERLIDKGYSASAGLISAPIAGLDIDDLIRQADTEMYREKKKYYSAKGTDRRKNREESET